MSSSREPSRSRSPSLANSLDRVRITCTADPLLARVASEIQDAPSSPAPGLPPAAAPTAVPTAGRPPQAQANRVFTLEEAFGIFRNRSRAMIIDTTPNSATESNSFGYLTPVTWGPGRYGWRTYTERDQWRVDLLPNGPDVLCKVHVDIIAVG